MPEVIWRPCAEVEGYEASNDGRVRSIERVILCEDGIHERHYRSRELTPWLTRGYQCVQLVQGKGIRRKTYVHTLICEAFHGPRPSAAHQVRHLNGDKTDNRAENLKWGTASENNFDVVSHGRHANATKETCPRGHSYDVVWGVKRRERRCSRCNREAADASRLRSRIATAAQAAPMKGQP